jgi:hypothetical protein
MHVTLEDRRRPEATVSDRSAPQTRFSSGSPPSSNRAKKRTSGPRLGQLCPPCAMPFSNSSLDYRCSDALTVENGSAASSGVSKSAKVVLGRVLINRGCPAITG